MDPVRGGTVTAVLVTSELLTEQGVEVVVVSLDAPGTRNELGPRQFDTISLGPTRSFYGYHRPLGEWLRRNSSDFDAVIVEGCWQYPGLAVWQEARRAGVPYFVFPHGMLDPWFKRRYPLKHLKKWLYWPWAEYRILRDARAVLFTTEQERVLARQSFWLYKARERVVPFGIRCPEVDRARAMEAFRAAHPDACREPYLLFLGRIYEKKGVDLLLEVFPHHQLSKNHRLILAGPIGNVRFRGLVEDAIGKGRVSWIPMLQGDEKWGALAAAEALVLPSHQENFGLVIPEALAMGTPVLTTHPVNISPQIEADEAGFVEDDTVKGVVRLFDRWAGLRDEEKIRMRTAARRCFERKFDLRRGMDEFVRIIREELENPVPPH